MRDHRRDARLLFGLLHLMDGFGLDRGGTPLARAGGEDLDGGTPNFLPFIERILQAARDRHVRADQSLHRLTDSAGG
ncbi:MAG: hypothetical protein C4336_03470, partial [Armatimonadota bacterium]